MKLKLFISIMLFFISNTVSADDTASNEIMKKYYSSRSMEEFAQKTLEEAPLTHQIVVQEYIKHYKITSMPKLSYTNNVYTIQPKNPNYPNYNMNVKRSKDGFFEINGNEMKINWRSKPSNQIKYYENLMKPKNSMINSFLPYAVAADDVDSRSIPILMYVIETGELIQMKNNFPPKYETKLQNFTTQEIVNAFSILAFEKDKEYHTDDAKKNKKLSKRIERKFDTIIHCQGVIKGLQMALQGPQFTSQIDSMSCEKNNTAKISGKNMDGEGFHFELPPGEKVLIDLIGDHKERYEFTRSNKLHYKVKHLPSSRILAGDETSSEIGSPAQFDQRIKEIEKVVDMLAVSKFVQAQQFCSHCGPIIRNEVPKALKAFNDGKVKPTPLRVDGSK